MDMGSEESGSVFCGVPKPDFVSGAIRPPYPKSTIRAKSIVSDYYPLATAPPADRGPLFQGTLVHFPEKCRRATAKPGAALRKDGAGRTAFSDRDRSGLEGPAAGVAREIQIDERALRAPSGGAAIGTYLKCQGRLRLDVAAFGVLALQLADLLRVKALLLGLAYLRTNFGFDFTRHFSVLLSITRRLGAYSARRRMRRTPRRTA